MFTQCNFALRCHIHESTQNPENNELNRKSQKFLEYLEIQRSVHIPTDIQIYPQYICVVVGFHIHDKMEGTVVGILLYNAFFNVPLSTLSGKDVDIVLVQY